MTKHLGLAPSVFLRIFTRYTVGDFFLIYAVKRIPAPYFHSFSTYAVSDICGHPHTGEIDKIRPSIFVL